LFAYGPAVGHHRQRCLSPCSRRWPAPLAWPPLGCSVVVLAGDGAGHPHPIHLGKSISSAFLKVERRRSTVDDQAWKQNRQRPAEHDEKPGDDRGPVQRLGMGAPPTRHMAVHLIQRDQVGAYAGQPGKGTTQDENHPSRGGLSSTGTVSSWRHGRSYPWQGPLASCDRGWWRAPPPALPRLLTAPVAQQQRRRVRRRARERAQAGQLAHVQQAAAAAPIDAKQIAERVYELMRKDIAVQNERRGRRS